MLGTWGAYNKSRFFFYAKDEAEIIKNENHLQTHNPSSYQFQPHVLLAGDQGEAVVVFLRMTGEPS